MKVSTRVAVAIGGLALTGAAVAVPPPIVNFEQMPDSPTEGTQVLDQFWESHGLRIYDGVPGHAMRIAKVGAPFKAFRGFLGDDDRPFPGASVGQSFITDETFGTGMSPGPFVLEYRWPVSRISGVFLDVNERESWRAEAFTADGESRGTVEVFPTSLPGVALSWSLETDSAVITKVVITFTGQAAPSGVTFAMDNLSGSAPSCLADRNGDDIVDFMDYLAYLTEFAEGSSGADLNRDGVVDFSDYLEFLTAFDAGC